MVLFPQISDQRFLLGFRRRLLWPCPHASAYPNTLENRDFFFLRYSLPSRLKRRFRAPKMQVFGNGNAGLSLSSLRAGVFVWTDENRGFQKCWRPFSSTEPVVSWSRGRVGYKLSRVALGTRIADALHYSHRTAHALLGMLSYFHRFSVFVWTGKMIPITTCGRVFFLKRRKKSPFLKVSGYVWTRPQSSCRSYHGLPSSSCENFNTFKTHAESRQELNHLRI